MTSALAVCWWPAIQVNCTPRPSLCHIQLFHACHGTSVDTAGKGSFGEVYRGYDRRTTLPVAIKIIDLESAEDEIDDIQQEIQILGQLDSDCITR